jgi:hypothetical protein
MPAAPGSNKNTVTWTCVLCDKDMTGMACPRCGISRNVGPRYEQVMIFLLMYRNFFPSDFDACRIATFLLDVHNSLCGGFDLGRQSLPRKKLVFSTETPARTLSGRLNFKLNNDFRFYLLTYASSIIHSSHWQVKSALRKIFEWSRSVTPSHPAPLVSAEALLISGEDVNSGGLIRKVQPQTYFHTSLHSDSRPHVLNHSCSE